MRASAGPRTFAAVLSLFGIGFPASADETQRVGFSGLDNALVEGGTTVFAKAPNYSSDLTVFVTIDTAGRVMDAEVGSNFDKVDPAPGLAAARQWRFRPQTFEGKPVIAVGWIKIWYAPPGDPPDPAAVFPQSSLADTTIVLERGACYGSCPDYKVSVSGNGDVRFTTEGFGFPGTANEVFRAYNGHSVLLPGTHVAHVDPALVAGLIERFRAARFFGLKPSYEANITDSSTVALTFQAGGSGKRVVDYVGRAVGMPTSVIALEEAVDKIAGTDRWVYGNAGTLLWLESTGFDFRSEEAARLAAAAGPRMWTDEGQDSAGALIMSLIDRGVPLDAKVRSTPTGPRLKLGPLLALNAAIAGNEAVLERLARRGYLAQVKKHDLDQAFARGRGCSPAVAKALVKAGADPAATYEGGTALTALRESGSGCEGLGEERLVEMARTLIDLGVPLEARDDIHRTVLMGCDSPGLARLLIARGADVNARDDVGTTPVLATSDDRVALILLRAGADARAKNKYGSVREQAVAGHWPATLAWLDAHGVR